MKAICPNNPDHKTFETVAHVSQDWKVDETGNFLEVVDESVETVAFPNPDNTWTCCTCGAEATVTVED